MSPSQKSHDATASFNKPVTDEAVLKVTKEIVVKFIEAGRLSPQNFEETFVHVHKTVKDAVRS